MANPYDQFDATAAPVVNPYDQFDAHPAAPQAQPASGITADNVVRSLARGIPGMDKLAAGADAATHGLLGRGSDAPTIGERYHTNLEHERGIDQAYDQAHPVASTVGQIAGGTAALAPLAGAAAGRTLLGMGGATLPGAMARSAASGAGMGAAGKYIENEGWDNPEGVIGSGALGGAVGAAGPAVGRMVGSAVNRWRGTTQAAVPPTGQALRDAGDAGYQAARGTGLVLHGQHVADLSHIIEQDLLQRFNPQQAPETFGILHRMQAAPPGSTVDANGLMAVREQLANAARNHMNPREAAAAGPAIEHLDDYLTNTIQPHHVAQGDPAAFQQAYGQARANYGAGMRSERADEVARHAETSAASTGSGNNTNNKMRQGWNQVLRRDALRGNTGLNEPELAQADTVVRGSRWGNAQRLASNVLGGGGGMGRLHASGLGAAAGGLVGGPVGAAIGSVVAPTAGAAARWGAERSTQRGLNTLDEMIRRRAPLSAPANAAHAQMGATNNAAMGAGALGARAAGTPIARMLQQTFDDQPEEQQGAAHFSLNPIGTANAMDLPSDRHNPRPGRVLGEGGAGGPPERIEFKSAGARRGAPSEPTVEAPPRRTINDLTPEEKAAWKVRADAEMAAAEARVAKKKGVASVFSEIPASTERLDFKSSGARRKD